MTIPARQPPVRVADVIAATVKVSGIDREALTGPGKARLVAHWRHAAFAAARERTRASTTLIGRAFGRDHSTVIYGAAAARKRDPQLIEAIGEALA